MAADQACAPTNHEEMILGELDRDDLEWHTALVRPEEKDPIWLTLRRSGVDGVRAVLHDEPRSVSLDPMAPGGTGEGDPHSLHPFCPTKDELVKLARRGAAGFPTILTLLTYRSLTSGLRSTLGRHPVDSARAAWD